MATPSPVEHIDDLQSLERTDKYGNVYILRSGYRQRLRAYANALGYSEQGADSLADDARRILHSVVYSIGNYDKNGVVDVEERMKDLLHMSPPLPVDHKAPVTDGYGCTLHLGQLNDPIPDPNTIKQSQKAVPDECISPARSKLSRVGELFNPMPINMTAFHVAKPPRD